MVGPSSVVVVVAAALSLTGCTKMRDEQYVRNEKRFSTTGRPELALSTFNGSIDIRASDGPDVLVTVEAQGLSGDAPALDVRAVQDGNRITVDVQTPKGVWWFLGWPWWYGARMIVTTPAASDVVARSGDGAISVDGISGKVELRTGDGSIRGRQVSGEIDVRTGDGSITLEDAGGRIAADSGDGRIAVSGRFAAIRVRTGDGSVALRVAPDSTATEDWDVGTGDGSITVELPQEFDAVLDARTGDGRIDAESLSLSDVAGRPGRNTLRGKMGAGGRTLFLRTGDGSIHLRQLPSAELSQR